MSFTRKLIYKIYTETGTFKGILNDVVSILSFTKTINGGLGECRIRLARKIDDYDEGDQIKYNNRVKIYLTDDDNTDKLIYQGYITAYNPFLNEKEEYVEITCLGAISKLMNDYFRSGTTLEISKSNVEIGQVFKDIIDNYRGLEANSMISNDYANVGNTGNNITYTFRTKKHLQAIKKVGEFLDYDWYWFLNSDGKLKVAQRTSAAHTFILKKNIKGLKVHKNIESVINYFFFWNGKNSTDPAYLKSEYSDATSKSNYDIISANEVDGRVTVQATADLKGNAVINDNKNPRTRTTLVIGKEYDLASIEPGDTCNIRNIDTTQQTTFADDMLIVKVKYTPDEVLLELAELGADINTIISSDEDSIEKRLKNLQDSLNKIDQYNLEDGAVVEGKIGDREITNAKVKLATMLDEVISATAEIKGTKLYSGAVEANRIQTNSLAADCVTSVKIVANCIIANHIGTNEIIAHSACIKDAIIIDAKIVSLGVNKLVAGTISSKAISLGITADAGDCYISGGAGLNYANWTADKGFILGLDDSDSDKAKFFIGDHANNKYFSFDGTNTNATGFRYIETFTAGLAITVNDAVYTYNNKVYPTCGACPVSAYNFIGFALETVNEDDDVKIQTFGKIANVGSVIDTDYFLTGNTQKYDSYVVASPNIDTKIYGVREVAMEFATGVGETNLVKVVLNKLGVVGSPGNLIIEIWSEGGYNGGPNALLKTLEATISEPMVASTNFKLETLLDRPLELTAETDYWIVLRSVGGDSSSNYWRVKALNTSPCTHTRTSDNDWSTNSTTIAGEIDWEVWGTTQAYGTIADNPIGTNGEIYIKVGRTYDNSGLLIEKQLSRFWADVSFQIQSTGKYYFRCGFRPKMITIDAYFGGVLSRMCFGQAFVGVNQNVKYLNGSNIWSGRADKVVYAYFDASNETVGEMSTITNYDFAIDFTSVNKPTCQPTLSIQVWG